MKLVRPTPDTLTAAPTWHTQAACAAPQFKAHEDLWFARPGDQQAMDAAKRICRSCPVMQECGQYALAERIEHGVWGGMTNAQRMAIRRSATRRSRAKPLTSATGKQPPPQTLEEAFNRRAHHTDDGHILWEGNVTFKFKGTAHNALRLAFTLGHGREPEGPVDRTCDRVCFAAEHLIDRALKASGALCGTRRGYHWHQRAGEPTCGPCRQANTDADNRLRRTSTTKAAA